VAKPSAAVAPKGLNLDVPPARTYQAPPSAAAKVEKRDRERTPEDRAEADFRRAAVMLNQGRAWEAQELFASALALSPAHESARQALVALSLEHNKVDDARRLLQEGVAINPGNARFASVLARIHLERRNYAAAVDVVNNVRQPEQSQADLQLLRGTALQKLGRHAEAVESFQSASRGEQQNGPALIGLATSLEALMRRSDAADAYRRAAVAPSLNQDVRTYAAQRARALQ
jgi:MSHA biogenesis protein MshN